MIKDIVKDKAFLSQKCERADSTDKGIIKDLLDTANNYKEKCCGLAAPQIGYKKRICVIRANDKWVVMINPLVTKKAGMIVESEEGCMSFDGIHTVKRNTEVEVMFTDTSLKHVCRAKLKGFVAIIAQHEIDHLNGITIA